LTIVHAEPTFVIIPVPCHPHEQMGPTYEDEFIFRAKAEIAGSSEREDMK
jgi:hypothetical protein